MFEHHISDKELVSKIYQGLPNKKRKTTQVLKRWEAEDLNRCRSKKDIQMADGYLKKCSTSLVIKVNYAN